MRGRGVSNYLSFVGPPRPSIQIGLVVLYRGEGRRTTKEGHWGV